MIEDIFDLFGDNLEIPDADDLDGAPNLFNLFDEEQEENNHDAN